MSKAKIAVWLGSALLLCVGQAQAEISWRFDSNPHSGYTVLDDTSVSLSSAGINVTAQAWSNTGGAGVGSTSSSTAAGYGLDTAYLNVSDGGIGVRNLDASPSTGDVNENSVPEDAIDNNQRYDSILFDFSSSVDLNSVTIGYVNGDSDITVLAYTANSCSSGTCSSDVSGKTYAQLASYGWQLIGHYSNLINDAATSINAANVRSSRWLIGAYNPLVGGTSSDTTKDHIKLLALAGDKYTAPDICFPGQPCAGVPEPGTLLLMAAGLLGITRYAKRRARK